jgi:trk system potassium uptake protein TrkA
MKIIIAGGGEVGFHLAKLLSFESLDIILIDTDKDRLNYAESHLDIKAIKGDALSLSLMKEAQVASADLFIAVTAEQATNITICALAKQMGCKRTIARISNFEFTKSKETISFQEIGVDELISPEELAVNEIQQLLDQSAFSNSYEFEEGALTLIGTRLEEYVPFVGKSVKEAASIFPDVHFMPIAIQRKGTQTTIIPRGDTCFETGDTVFFITIKEGVEELYKLTGKKKTAIKNIMILGGGRIGYNTARELCDKKFKVTIVEKNKKKAFEIADLLPNALVINGDGRNIDLLDEEELSSMDAFISVTGNSETNIMSCLMAKTKNVNKTIALVENMDYFQLSYSIGIDTLINKKLLTANTIFRYIRKGDVVDMRTLNNLNVEILEFVVNAKSEVANYKIKDVDFPRTAIIGGVIKESVGIIALGDYTILPGDRIVVCCLPRSISRIERLFL